MIQELSLSATYKQLRKQNKVFSADKPLATNITVQLVGVVPTDMIQRIMGMHTSTNTYLRNVKFGPERLNLDGSSAGPIRIEHKEMARLKLSGRISERFIRKHMLTASPEAKVGLTRRLLKRKKALNKKIEDLILIVNKDKV
jgi:ProP effector